MHYRLLLSSIALALASASSASADDVSRLGDLEMHSTAVPTNELTAEAAKAYNISPESGRGLLTVTLIKKAPNGRSRSVSGQVYAGAVTQENKLFTIPIREVHRDEGVYYLGEYRINAPDTIRFLVNANVLGKPMKVEFSRAFSKP